MDVVKDVVNWSLKAEVGKRFGTQIEAAKSLGMTRVHDLCPVSQVRMICFPSVSSVNTYSKYYM